MCLVLGIRTSVGVLALPFRQTKPVQPSCHSRKSILGSIFTVLNACFSFKLRITVWSQACMFRVYKEICICTQDMFTDYKKQMTSQEFAHEHVFKGLNDR